MAAQSKSNYPGVKRLYSRNVEQPPFLFYFQGYLKSWPNYGSSWISKTLFMNVCGGCQEMGALRIFILQDIV